MEIDLTDEQREMVNRAIGAGRLRTPEDAVKEAIQLWEARERERDDLRRSLDAASAAIKRGHGITLTSDSCRDILDDIRRRGRERVATERQSPV